MVHKIVKIFGIICVVLLIAGCVEQKIAKADDGRITTIYHMDRTSATINGVYHDNINNVTIYTSSYGGISAIPDWQLKAPTNNS